MTTTSELIDGLVDIDSEILEPTYNEKIRKLKEKNKIITQEKEFYFDNFTKYQKEIEPKYKEKINSLTQDLSNCERELLQYKEAERSYNAIIIDLKERHDYDKERINNLANDLKRFKDYAEEKTIELETDVRSKAVMIEAIEKLNRELQVESANIKKEVSSYHFCLSDKILTTPSYSTPSQNSDNNDCSNDPNKRQHSANNKDPDNRQNSANSNRNNDSYKRQSSTNNDRSNDPNK
ncbi:9846_t:CDS:2, partial [Entrophospora sp. SA101]